METKTLLLIIGILGILTAIFSGWAAHKKTKYLLLILIFIGTGTAVCTTILAVTSEEEKVQYEHRLLLSSYQNLSATNKIAFVTDKIAQKNEEIAELNKKLALKSEEVANYLSGGNSFCILQLDADPWNKPIISVANVGKYPIYELAITILNETKRDFDKHYGIGTLPADKTWVNGGDWDLSSLPFSYYIIFDSRNGKFFETYKKKVINGVTKIGIQVFKDDKKGRKKLIYKKVPNDFPKDKNGFI